MEALFLALVLSAPCDGGVCLVPPTVTQGVEVPVTATVERRPPVRRLAKGTRAVVRRVVSVPVRLVRAVRERERRPVRRLLGRLLRRWRR
jgi:hypothetical protein